MTPTPTKSDLFVDTAGWASSLYSRDPIHAQVAQVLGTAVRRHRRLITTNYVLAGLVPLLSRVFTRPRVLAAVNTIKANPHVTILHIDAATDDEAWKLLEARADKAWSLVDSSSFVLMRHYSIKDAVTTDHHFTQAQFNRLPSP